MGILFDGPEELTLAEALGLLDTIKFELLKKYSVD